MEMATVATERGDADGHGGDSNRDVETTIDAHEPTPADVAASRPIMLMLLSSEDDDDSFSDSDDDAATMIGSPLAQPDPLTPPGQGAVEAPTSSSGWMSAKPAVTSSPRGARSAPPTRIEDVFAARPRQLQAEAAHDGDGDEDEDDAFDSFPPASQQSDVILSPSSQLHILSQISEMASMRAAREREAAAAAATSVPRPSRPAHAWAPVVQRAQAQAQQLSSVQPTQANAAKKTKKRKTPTNPPTTSKQPKPTKTLGPGLVADIATWEAFNEPILAGDDDTEDDWSFEEISDSDF